MGSHGAPSATLTVLGSGTLAPSDVRSSPAHVLESPDHLVLLDCGPGTLHRLAVYRIAWEALSHVGLTHFHNDHLSDLPALMTAFRHAMTSPRYRPLTLFGPVGLGALLERMSTVGGSSWLDQDFPVLVEEIEDGGSLRVEPGRGLRASPTHPHEPLRVRATSTPHTDESLAYRISGPWGSVGYTGDTGPSTDLARAMAGVDVLLAECTHPEPVESGSHLSPPSVASLASIACPRVLVLTHVFPPGDPEEVASRVRARYDGRVVAARDGLRLRLSGGSVTVDPPASGL